MLDDDNQKKLDKLNQVGQQPAVVEPPKEKTDEQKDYEFTRNKLRNLISDGQSALDHFMEIAMESSEPGMAKAVTDLLNVMGKLTVSVMENAERKTHVDGERLKQDVISGNITDKSKGGGVAKTVFIGDTASLLEAIKKELEPPKKEVIDVESVEVTNETST